MKNTPDRRKLQTLLDHASAVAVIKLRRKKFTPFALINTPTGARQLNTLPNIPFNHPNGLPNLTRLTALALHADAAVVVVPFPSHARTTKRILLLAKTPTTQTQITQRLNFDAKQQFLYLSGAKHAAPKHWKPFGLIQLTPAVSASTATLARKLLRQKRRTKP